MELASKYNPGESENKWYEYWMENKFFHSVPDEREPFTILIPPPNVTGILHMGHILNNTIQDILIRRARMQGKNACWVPGMDHASIATEAKVVKKLKAEGLSKEGIGREKFLEEAWNWKEKHGGLILKQLKKLGASCDWDRTKFTMDQDLSESVIKVFIDLYNEGLIYRGFRMINWDSEAKTALSDEEVIHKEVSSTLYYVKYPIEGTADFMTVATTRPETILGDTALCVNPKDERYQRLHGKTVRVPLINRRITIIADDYVDAEFGTGCLKVTPAHDINDYEIGLRHDLEVINLFNEDGSLNESAQLLVGMDRFEARKAIVELLKKEGLLVKTEQITNKVGFSERTNSVVEPRISKQWFCKMDEMAKPALENVMNDEIRFHPNKFKNTYKHWMENIRDWCISRQLWWGHRIPAWYNSADQCVVAASREEAEQQFQKKGWSVNGLHQDPDVIDTWFSSWLWPMSVFDGVRNPDNKEFNYYYPTNDLVTAPDIIFFWVARMIMISYHNEQKKPFQNVYFTGIVRDAQRRKMSKQLGNSPDPLDLIDTYGADGVRVGMLLSAPAGNDLLFDENLCQQGRNFSNKMWNAFRLVKGWEISAEMEQSESSLKSVEWFHERLNSAIIDLENSYKEYRISEALMTTYKLIWDDFCSWYLEMIKPPYQQPIDEKTYANTLEFFEKLMILAHPFMPFITEEIWHNLEGRSAGQTIMFRQWPNVEKVNKAISEGFEEVKELITSLRNFRKEKNIPTKVQLSLIRKGENTRLDTYASVVKKLANLSEIQVSNQKVEKAFSFLVNTNEYFIPFTKEVDASQDLEKIEKELNYTRGFLKSIEGKLNNSKFVSNAPEQVLQNELKKKSDAEQRIRILESQLKAIN